MLFLERSHLHVSPSLGACIENALLSRHGILDYSKLPTMITTQGELVGSLTLMSSQTVSMLSRHPAHLSALLQQYVKQQSPEGEGGADQDPTQTEGAA